MTHIVCYNKTTKGKQKTTVVDKNLEILQTKRSKNMNGTMRRNQYELDSKLMAEDCNFSTYSMAAVAGGILLCIGIILYALLTL